MRKFKFFILLNILLLQFIKAQYTGKVLDENLRPLQDVMILNIRTNDHTHTDSEGSFIDKKSESGDTIQFSYLGYKTLQRVLSENEAIRNVKIIMEEAPLVLNLVNVSVPLQRTLQQIDIRMNPVQNSQELIRKVPGLFIAQHAGGGKAEQMFLRGFDLDHGTDIAISVDHILPVNMVSHAHGQGYADLHFIIPETVKNIDFEKGSYNASKGNLATAGYVDFILKDKIQNNIITFESGKFQYNRFVGQFKLFDNQNSNSYFAGEYVTTNGYFDHPQNFNKFNGLLKYNYTIDSHSGLKLTGTYFTSTWNASGQIPERAVASGLIERFGALDPNEGGQTSRKNVMLQYYLSKKADQLFKLTGFFSHYNFELYSNFTFYLNDTINGDLIRQKEQRTIIGLESSFDNHIGNLEYNAAIGTRIDNVNDIELSHTKDRTITLDRKSLGDVNEQDIYSYLKINWNQDKWEIQLQSRSSDLYHTGYTDKLTLPNKTTNRTEFKVSPKLNVFYKLYTNLQVYAKSGLGFHSNDSRLLNYESNANLLTRSIDADFGLQIKLGNDALLHAGIWYIDLQDELVYVGDEAIVESSGHTERKGLEAGLRYQPVSWLSLDAEGSYTLAKSVGNPEKQNYIPLASKWCSSGGITIQNIKNVSFALRYRYLGDRPANEDYSITAKGYNLFDGTINYKYNTLNFGLIVENIFNTKWNEAQFATLSRLKNEVSSVDEIHFTPGTPFNFRFRVQVQF